MRRIRIPVSPLIQRILAVVLLILGLVYLPAFAGFLLLLPAATLATPIRTLRDLLSSRGVRGRMIAAAAAVLTVLGFVVYPAR